MRAKPAVATSCQLVKFELAAPSPSNCQFELSTSWQLVATMAYGHYRVNQAITSSAFAFSGWRLRASFAPAAS